MLHWECTFLVVVGFYYLLFSYTQLCGCNDLLVTCNKHYRKRRIGVLNERKQLVIKYNIDIKEKDDHNVHCITLFLVNVA